VRLFDLDHPDTLAAAMCLSNIYRSTGQIDEAMELAEDTIRRYPGVYGPDHPYNHGCSGNLAILLRVTGDVAGARKRNEDALTGLEAKLGRDHHYSLTVAADLASDLAALGELQDAVALGRGTLRRLRTGAGRPAPDDPAVGRQPSGRPGGDRRKEPARELSVEIEESYRQTLGLEHPDAKVFLDRRRLDADFDPPI
jgi:hypothetical protein